MFNIRPFLGVAPLGASTQLSVPHCSGWGASRSRRNKGSDPTYSPCPPLVYLRRWPPLMPRKASIDREGLKCRINLSHWWSPKILPPQKTPVHTIKYTLNGKDTVVTVHFWLLCEKSKKSCRKQWHCYNVLVFFHKTLCKNRTKRQTQIIHDGYPTWTDDKD